MTVLAGEKNWDIRRRRLAVIADSPDLPDALCVNYDPEIWHPPRPSASAEAEAAEICGRCPEQRACLAWALIAQGQGVLITGIWGGYTEDARADMLDRPGVTEALSA